MQTLNSNIGIPLEDELRNQLFNALQGNIVTTILKEAKVRKFENPWRNILEGHSFKVDENISSKLFNLFTEVKDKLGFTEPLDFYITSSSDINAFAISSLEDDEPNIINLNSAMLQLMNDEELKFIIGHEIGHLLSKNAELHKLIYFVFPDASKLPGLLQNKIRLWNQLSELIADRYGFLACQDLPTCISAFFKMSSGLDAERVDLDIFEFLKENENRLEFFANNNGLSLASHPVNPVRVKAIELFSETHQFSDTNDQERPALGKEEFQQKIDELISVLLKLKNSELDYHISYFLAASGLLIAGLDEEFDEKEIEIITHTLSNYYIFPKRFLTHIYDSGKVWETFNSAVNHILEINPMERENMLGYMINISMADNNITREELEFIFSAGKQVFGYSKKEVAQIFAHRIQQGFIPSTSVLS